MKLIQVAQHAGDLDRAAEFYAQLLEAEPRARFDKPGLLFFDVGGVRLLLEKDAPSALLYLEVADLPGRIESLRSHGVKILAGPQLVFTHDDGRLGPSGSEEWMGFIEDSEGNALGLVSRIRPAGD